MCMFANSNFLAYIQAYIHSYSMYIYILAYAHAYIYGLIIINYGVSSRKKNSVFISTEFYHRFIYLIEVRKTHNSLILVYILLRVFVVEWRRQYVARSCLWKHWLFANHRHSGQHEEEDDEKARTFRIKWRVKNGRYNLGRTSLLNTLKHVQ